MIGGRDLAGVLEVALVLDAILFAAVVVDADALDELVCVPGVKITPSAPMTLPSFRVG